SWNTLSNFGIAELRNCEDSRDSEDSEDSRDSGDSGDRPHVLERGLTIVVRFGFVAPLQSSALIIWRLLAQWIAIRWFGDEQSQPPHSYRGYGPGIGAKRRARGRNGSELTSRILARAFAFG
ncbi:MAG: hypothetical protein RL215_1647, partial [Planctomycetota bacterium]